MKELVARDQEIKTILVGVLVQFTEDAVCFVLLGFVVPTTNVFKIKNKSIRAGVGEGGRTQQINSSEKD